MPASMPVGFSHSLAAASDNLALMQAPQMQISDMLAERWATGKESFTTPLLSFS